jgi:N-acyl-D-aspartate/D-glutamate deacylase
LDYLLKGGFVVDGTGRPGYVADVGIADGRIAAIGAISDPAEAVLDVTGLTVTPGFIDVHTHYDAQVNWDGEVTPSSWHGVTTVIGGNCGFTLAPVDDRSIDYILRMLAVVEGIPYSALQTIDGSWDSFGSWLDRLEETLAVNAGFLVGHCALRRLVMGDASVGEAAAGSGPVGGAAASDDELRRMKQLLGSSLLEGALGLSTSRSGHTDHDGLPVPSRGATERELLALCSVVSDHPGTIVNFSPDELFGTEFSETMQQLIVGMASAARRPLVINGPGKLVSADRAAAAGGHVAAMFLPHGNPLRLNLLTGIVYDSVPGWGRIMHLPHDDKVRALSDPQTRGELRTAAKRVPHMAYVNFADTVLYDARSPSLSALVGRALGDIGAARGADPFDTLLDLALADDLQAGFLAPTPPDNHQVWAERARLLCDPRTVMAGSDAGAHLDMVMAFDCATRLVGPAVRDFQVISLEEAVRQATDVPARTFGLHDRGRVLEGWIADLVLFDAERINALPATRRDDLPGGAWRLAGRADGIHHVFVNGVRTMVDGGFTGDRPGTVLRSGRDTETVGPPYGRHR